MAAYTPIRNRHDEPDLALTATLAKQLGRRPGRNELMKHYGWGAAKASRLLKLHDQETTPPETTDHDDATPPPDQTSPDRVIPPPEQTTTPGGESAAPAPTGPVKQSAAPRPAPAPRSAPPAGPAPRSAVALWPLRIAALLVAGSAFVAIWGGWVHLGEMTGFGEVDLLPGFGSGLVLNLAITLPLGIEAYATLALYVWVGDVARTRRTKRFAAVSAVVALCIGFFGQAVYHVLAVAGRDTAPWPIVTFVACLPVVVLGMSAALLHMVTADHHTHTTTEDTTR